MPTTLPTTPDPLIDAPNAAATPDVTTGPSGAQTFLNADTPESPTPTPTGTTAATVNNVPADSPSVDPAQRVINPATDTVEGRVNNIISKDSPVMQTARTQTAQVANSRGLINSSMANQAGEQAVINSAVQMATPDAAAYNRAGEVNVNAENETALQAMKGSQAQALADTEASYKGLLQTSASATSYFTTVSNNITAILNDPVTSQAAKQSLLLGQQQLLKSGLAIIGAIGNVDLGGLLDFSAP